MNGFVAKRLQGILPEGYSGSDQQDTGGRVSQLFSGFIKTDQSGSTGSGDKWGLNFIERKAGAKYGTEEYWAYVDAHPELKEAAKIRGGKFAPPDPYRVSEETKKIYEGSQEAAGTIREMAQESVDVAASQRGMIEGLGAGQERAARAESTAAAVSSVAEVGGASSSALGAISQIQQGNISSMRDAAIQTQMFRDQAEKDYRQALMDKGGAEVAAISTEIQGLQELGRAKEQQYQVNILDPFYTKQQYDLQMGMAEATKKPTFGEQVSSAMPWNW